jgi:hypothetical protein
MRKILLSVEARGSTSSSFEVALSLSGTSGLGSVRNGASFGKGFQVAKF